MNEDAKMFNFVRPEPRAGRRYEIRSVVETTSDPKQEMVSVAHDDGRGRSYRVSHFQWIDLGPVLEPGLYVDHRERVWEWSGSKWSLISPPPELLSPEKPTGKVIRLRRSGVVDV